jgi:hypothetical protein
MNTNHFFSVNYSELSQGNANLIKTEVARTDASVSMMSMTKNRSDNEVYLFTLSSVQNTKIVVLNEETGNSVVITPTEGAPTQFELSPFFIEELKRAALGDADRYLVVETNADFSIRNVTSVSTENREVFIPRYFYGPKENVKEALPKDRQIVHIFKEKPRFIPAFPNDPEKLRLIAQLEEEMSYYVYMYQLPDGTLIIYDEHFNPINPNAEKNEVNKSTRNTNLQFNLSGNLNTQQRAATEHAQNIWSAELLGTIPIDIEVRFLSMGSGILGGSYRQPHYWNSVTQTWYSSTLGKQLEDGITHNLVDIRLEMSSNYSWHYGITGNPSSSQYDWITVMLHEITHGLGFSTLVQSNGSYVYTTSGGIQNTPTNFPGIFDRQLYQGSTLGTNLPDLNQSQRASLVVSNNLFSGRPSSFLLAANSGDRVKMFAPNPWRAGSSVVHWDNSVTFPTFMKYSASPGFKQHTINVREIAIMQDMGWRILYEISGPATLICSSPSTFTIQNFPPGATVTWTQSFNLAQVSGSGNTMTFRAAAGLVSGGPGWIEATVNGVQLRRLHISWVGVPNMENTDIGIGFTGNPYSRNLCRNVTYTLIAHQRSDENNPITGYVWDFGSWSPYVTNYQPSPSGIANAYVDIRLDGSAPAFQIVLIAPINPCSPNYGTGIDEEMFPIGIMFYAVRCFRESLPYTVEYPSPASSVLPVQIIPHPEQVAVRTGRNAVDLKYDIRLYDRNSNAVRQLATEEEQFQFDISDLPNGNYSLHIYDDIDDTPIVQQVIIENSF